MSPQVHCKSKGQHIGIEIKPTQIYGYLCLTKYISKCYRYFMGQNPLIETMWSDFMLPLRCKLDLLSSGKLHSLDNSIVHTTNLLTTQSTTTDPALQSVGMSFLSGNLSVLSGSRGTSYTTQHSRYYELYYFTNYISFFSLTLQNYWFIYGCTFEIFTTRFNRVHNLSSPRYIADSSLALSFQNSLISNSIPP